VGEIYSFTVSLFFFLSCFFDQATNHNSQRILMCYGMAQKDFVWRSDVPFEYLKF